MKKIIGLCLIICINSFLFLSSCIFSSNVDFQPIIFYGDSRTGHEIHEKIIGEIIKIDPSLVFHTGDMVCNGFTQEEWDIFNAIVAPLLKIVDFYPALGNHENNSPIYYNNFNLPNNEKWYWIEENGIHYIVLDSNSECCKGSEQYNWLENDLKNIPNNNKFIIVIFHHPPFSTGPHIEDEKNLRDSIVPLFEKYGVKIVFNGHDHCYERSFVNGIFYIVTGGGGAPLYDQARISPFSQVFFKSYHFCKLMMENDQLVIQVYDLNSNIIDEFRVG